MFQIVWIALICKYTITDTVHLHTLISRTDPGMILYTHKQNRKTQDVIPEASILFLKDSMRIICMMHIHYVVAKENLS